MLNLITPAWLTCVEWGRLAIQAFGGGNGDPDTLHALDEANKNALPVDEAGSANRRSPITRTGDREGVHQRGT